MRTLQKVQEQSKRRESELQVLYIVTCQNVPFPFICFVLHLEKQKQSLQMQPENTRKGQYQKG